MTVAELIEKLEDMPGDLEVVVEGRQGDLLVVDDAEEKHSDAYLTPHNGWRAGSVVRLVY